MAESSKTAQPPVTEQDGTSDRKNASRTPQPIVSQASPTPTQARISQSRTRQRVRGQQTGQPTGESSEKTQPPVTERAGTSDVRNVSPIPQPRVSAAPQTPTNPQARISHSRTRHRMRGQHSGRPMASSSETTQPSLMSDQVATLEIMNASATSQPKVSQQTQSPTNPQVRISRTKRKSRMRGQVDLLHPEHQRLLSRIIPNPPVTVDAPQLGNLGQILSPVSTKPAAQTYSPLYHTPPRVQAQQQLQPTIGQQDSSIPPTSLQLRAPHIHSSVSMEPASQIYPHLGHTPAPQAQGPQQIPPAVTRGQSDSIPPTSLQQSASQIQSSVLIKPAAQMHAQHSHTPASQLQVQQQLPPVTGGRRYSIPPTDLQQSASQIQSSVLMKPAAQMHPQHSHTPASQLQVQKQLPPVTGGRRYSISPTSLQQSASQIQSSVSIEHTAPQMYPLLYHTQPPGAQGPQQIPPAVTRGHSDSFPPTSLQRSAPQINSSVSMEPAAQMHSRLYHTPTRQVQVQQHLPSVTGKRSYSISPTSLHQSVPRMYSSVPIEPTAPQMYPLLYHTPAPEAQGPQQIPPAVTRGQSESFPPTSLQQSAPQINNSVSMEPAAQMHSRLYHTPTPQVQVQQHLPSVTGKRSYSISPTSLHQSVPQMYSSVPIEPTAPQMYPLLYHTPAPEAQGPQQIPPAVTRGQSDSIPPTSLQQSAPQINSSVSMEPAAQMHSRLFHTPTPQVQVQQHLPSVTSGRNYSISPTSLHQSFPQMHSSVSIEPTAPQMYPLLYHTPAPEAQGPQQIPPAVTRGQSDSIPPTSLQQSAPQINNSVSMEPAAQMHSRLFHTPTPQVQVQQHLPSVTSGRNYSISPTSLHQSVPQMYSSVPIEPTAPQMYPLLYHTPAPEAQGPQQIPPAVTRGQSDSIPPTSLQQSAPQINSSVSMEPAAQMHSRLFHTPTPQVQVQQHLPSVTGGRNYSISPTSRHQSVPQMHSSVSIEPAAPQMYPLLYQTPSPQLQAQQQFPPLTSGQGHSLPPTRPHQSAPQINSSVSMEVAAQMHPHLHHTPAPQVQQQLPPMPGEQSYSFPPTSLHQSAPEIHSSVSIEPARQMDTHPHHTPALQVHVQQQLTRRPLTRLLGGFLQIYSRVLIDPAPRMFPYLYHTSAPQVQVQQQLPRMTGVQSSSIPPTRLQQSVPQIQNSVSIEPAAPQTSANLYHTPAPQVQEQPQLPPMIGWQSYSIPDRSSIGGVLRDVPFSEMLAQLVAPVGPLRRRPSQINCVPDHFVYATLKSQLEKEEASYKADVDQLLTERAREEEELRRKYDTIERERASKLIADCSAPRSSSEQPNAAPGLTQCHSRAEAVCGSSQAGSSSRLRAQRPGHRNPYTSPQRNVVGQNVGSGPYRELSSTDVNVRSGPVVPPLAPPFPTNFPSTRLLSSHEPSRPASASFSRGSGPSPIASVVVSSMRSPLNALVENLSSHHNNLESVSDPTTSTAPATFITTADIAPIVTGAVVSVGPCSLNTNFASPPDSPPH